MHYEISNLTNEEVNISDLEIIINKVSDMFELENNIVSIVLVDNNEIHRINKEYRNIDSETDVISFAFMDELINPDSDLVNLGEIYICLDKAHSQAEEYGHSYKRELSFLLTHGLLHLLGYDHMNEEDEKEMFSLQDEILNSLEIWR